MMITSLVTMGREGEEDDANEIVRVGKTDGEGELSVC